MKSSRFAVAAHVLTILAFHEDEAVASDMLAGSVNTSAPVIRQLLTRLSRAGLVKSQLGKGGGSLLARPAQEITLLQIYEAVENDSVFCTHRNDPSDRCAVGRNILDVLCKITARAEGAMRDELESVTVADIAKKIRRKS